MAAIGLSELEAPEPSWFSGTTVALTTAATGILGFLLATLGYMRSGKRERHERETAERLKASEQIVADRDFFSQNYRRIIDDLRDERGHLAKEIRELRAEMVNAALECDRRITGLEKAGEADAIMIKNLQEQNRRQARQIAQLETRQPPITAQQ